jgi:hypothetical protein
MFTLVTDAKACIEANEHLLLATRHRLRISRRILYYPSLHFAGGSDVDGARPSEPGIRRPQDTVLREAVRQAIEQRRIPAREPEAFKGAVGVGRTCAVCEQPVTTAETDLELHFTRDGGAGPAIYHIHVRCYSAWARTIRDHLPRPHWARPISEPRTPQ